MLFVKLRGDLRASWSRFALMVVALAVSLTVFGGMLSAWSAIGRETSGAYMSTEPASATIVLERGLDAAVVAEAARRPGVLAATARTQFDGQVAVNGQPRKLPLQTFVAAPDDPMRVARFDLRQEGRWPIRPDEIWIGGDSLQLMGVAVGDTITLTPPGAQPLQLKVSGTVYDPSLAPSPQEQRGHAYLSSAALPLNLLKIQVGQGVPSRDRATVVDVAGQVGAWLQREKGVAVEEIQVPTPYAHPHQWQADVLLLSLMVGGAAALLLSAVLVATMLNNLFTQQIPQIGIMKAIGAGPGPIARLYLAMTLAVAAAATLIAIGPAVWIGRAGLSLLLNALGIQPGNLAAPWWAYAVMIAAGLCLPPLLALAPLVKASRTTVRAAIDHHGGAAASRTAGRILTRLNLNRGLLMALRNTVRRPARFWLSVGMLASAGTVFVAGMSLNTATQAVDDQRKADRYWDVDVQLDRPAAADLVAAAVARVPGVTRTQAWNRAQISVAGAGRLPFSRTYPDQGHGSIAVNTVPASFNPPPLLEGRWLKPGETGAVILNQVIRDNTVPGLGAGDSVQLFVDGKPTTWRIAGIVQEREPTGLGAYVTPEGFAAATGQPQQVNQLRVVTAGHDEPTRQTVADAVGRALTRTGAEVGIAASVSRAEAASAGHMGPVLLVLLGVALPLGVVGAIGLASSMSANVLDRTREFGVMHAIGAAPRSVRRIVVAEGVILALASCVVAILPTLGLTWGLGIGLGNLFTKAPLPFRVSPVAVGIWLALAVLGAALATDAAASRASRITVREALTYL